MLKSLNAEDADGRQYEKGGDRERLDSKEPSQKPARLHALRSDEKRSGQKHSVPVCLQRKIQTYTQEKDTDE